MGSDTIVIFHSLQTVAQMLWGLTRAGVPLASLSTLLDALYPVIKDRLLLPSFQSPELSQLLYAVSLIKVRDRNHCCS